MLGASRCLLNMFVVELTAGDVFNVSCFLLARSCWAVLLLICVVFGICSHFSDDLLCVPLTILLVYLDFQSMGHIISGFSTRAFIPYSSAILSAVWPDQWSWLTAHGLSLCLLHPGGYDQVGCTLEERDLKTLHGRSYVTAIQFFTGESQMQLPTYLPTYLRPLLL